MVLALPAVLLSPLAEASVVQTQYTYWAAEMLAEGPVQVGDASGWSASQPFTASHWLCQFATNLDTKKTGVDEWLVYSYEPKSATISLNFLMYKVIVSTGLAGSLLCLLLALVPLLQL